MWTEWKVHFLLFRTFIEATLKALPQQYWWLQSGSGEWWSKLSPGSEFCLHPQYFLDQSDLLWSIGRWAESYNFSIFQLFHNLRCYIVEVILFKRYISEICTLYFFQCTLVLRKLMALLLFSRQWTLSVRRLGVGSFSPEMSSKSRTRCTPVLRSVYTSVKSTFSFKVNAH